MEELDHIIAVLPPKYRLPLMILGIISPYITRAIHALWNGRGIKGVLAGIWLGTNVPKPKDPNQTPS